MAGNDFFRIGVGGDNDAGYAEVATGDNANEAIYVRQYTGVFQDLIRTLTLLDGSGNTEFPGEVWALAFHGHADSASNAARLEGYSIEQIRSFGTQVAVLTGEIAHGGTIPLPAGYTEAQCKWMVSMRVPWVEKMDGKRPIGNFITCYTTGRVVVCAGGSPPRAEFSSTANYIVIGVK